MDKPEKHFDTLISQQPYPLLFVTVSGAHLYGFPSADSDWDLRGVHLLPIREIAGFSPARETITSSGEKPGHEIDLVTHDIKKFLFLLLKKNGYVLEQLFSPLIVHTTPEHGLLKEIARNCITRHHSHHYLGFAQKQWQQFEEKQPYQVKPLLYVYRVLFTGIYLMRTRMVEANLVRLNQEFRLPHVADLIARKTAGFEHCTLSEIDHDFHKMEYLRLRYELESASTSSILPEVPSAKAALNDFLVRIRLTSAAHEI